MDLIYVGALVALLLWFWPKETDCPKCGQKGGWHSAGCDNDSGED